MDSTKDLDLKNLLVSWRCEILYNLFIEEDISLEELKLIKYHHVCHLLQTFKMGIRIRFEHYLEKWRNHIGSPLKNKEFRHHSSNDKYSCNCQHQSGSRTINDHQTEIESPSATSNLFISSVEDNLSNKRDSPVQSLEHPQEFAETDCPNGDPIPPETAKLESSHMLRSNNKRSRVKPPSEVNLSEYLANTMDADPPRVRRQCPFNLAEILRRSGSRASSVTKYYQQRKQFTNAHRTLLIQIICEFYEEHGYHLSLTASHEIENEILQMFPTEKLHYYRTEKRGKIYVKYTNMKRNKRERLTYKGYTAADDQKLRDEICSFRKQVLSDGGKDEYNLDTTSCDTFPERTVSQIYMKSENMTED